MEKVKYRYNRWRLALGRLVNLRYINRWIIFCADTVTSSPPKVEKNKLFMALNTHAGSRKHL